MSSRTDYVSNAVFPQALQPGDSIAVISPAAPSTDSDLDAGLAYLESIGLKPKLMPHARQKLFYLAGDDTGRLQDLHEAFQDPSVKGILAARGGYGCMRLLPHINWDLLKAHPKVFIGFSDLTSLQLPMFEKTGLICFHGPMLTSNLIENDPYTQNCLWDMVMGKVNYPYRIPNLFASSTEEEKQYYCFKGGIAEGRLIGGNLSLLAALCGTPYQPYPEGAILFIEDWREQYYSLDRQFLQLRMAGIFEGIAGLLLCDFVEIENSWEDYPLATLLQELTAFLEVPCGFGFSFGHGDQTATFPLGASARFDATNGHLEILSSPVDPAMPTQVQARPSARNL